jgi:two-component system, OmpR family, response regulator MprA
MSNVSNGRVLVVDDDPQVLSLLRRILLVEGFEPDICEDGESALVKAQLEPPDLMVLDLMLPGLDGLEVCRRMRQMSQAPILMLTARDAVADRVAGLEVGADDYLVKPFAFEELVARVKALLRRARPQTSEELSFGDLVLNTATRQVERAGQRINLTTREHDLLALFLEHPRRVLTRELIYRRVWGFDYLGESNTIDVYMASLRRKLARPGLPNLLHTIRGVGYALRDAD